ncbi:MAG: anaerobic glycerol-3-phosphate dehydrogenase subunit GlpA [Desulfobacteraceae bacterium]
METQVLIIGGGATGTGLARDLALREVPCILVEKGEINSGTSGANHGLLHSGARYVFSDPEGASECCKEAELLRRLAPHCIEETGGLFVAVEGDDEKYSADFPRLCSSCGIPVRELDHEEALEMEPTLSENLIAAYEVEDATIDPFMLSLENISQAQQLGTKLFCQTKVVGFTKDDRHIQAVQLLDMKTGEEFTVEAEQVVSASGPWAGEIAALANASIDMLYSKGSLMVTDSRVTKRVVNRLRPPGDGDILVPGGSVSILGTTSIRMDSLEAIGPTIEEMDLMVNEGAAMLPVLENARYIRAYAGVRPLVSAECDADDRCIARGFALLDHSLEGVENFFTITGGKLTTYRLMAERTADLVCQRLGIAKPCRTRAEPLPSTQTVKWAEPGLGPKLWLKNNNPEDPLLCECEMLPKSAIDRVIDSMRQQNSHPSLRGIGLRSRLGKGPCQGTTCAHRIVAHMYEQGDLKTNEGIANLREFFRARWKGERPVLWDRQLGQAELKESIYCGLLDLELGTTTDTEN